MNTLASFLAASLAISLLLPSCLSSTTSRDGSPASTRDRGIASDTSNADRDDADSGPWPIDGHLGPDSHPDTHLGPDSHPDTHLGPDSHLGPRCGNGQRDGDETDTDCGGSCAPCANGRGCVTNGDCSSTFCDTGSCKPPPSTSCSAKALGCVDSTHAAICKSSGIGWQRIVYCGSGGICEKGACIADNVRWHTHKSVHMGLITHHDAGQLSACAATSQGDLGKGRLICDVWHGVQQLKPRMAFNFGKSWYTFHTNNGDACAAKAPTDGLKCLESRLSTIGKVFHRAAPNMLLEAFLAEFIAKVNVPASQWPAVCRQGTIGHWGPETCVPDLEKSQAARDYLIRWGKMFIDAGVRAFMFGQLRLMAGGAGLAVSPKGAIGVKSVIDALRSYAASKGISRLFFGAQNTNSVKVNGKEQLDFVLGAMHLERNKNYLLQSLSMSGHVFYGAADLHDGNITNNANGLPVVLDYDNSGVPNELDDIRYLATLPDNAARARTILDHWRHLRIYNPNISLSIPLASTMAKLGGKTCQGLAAWHFSASACGLIGAIKTLFAEADRHLLPISSFNTTNPKIRLDYWGQELRGRDETASWLYRALLDRPIRPTEYAAMVSTLPLSIDTGAGARLSAAAKLIGSAEFKARNLSDSQFVDVVYAVMLLHQPDASGKSYWLSKLQTGASREQVLADIASSAEATKRYSP